MTLGQVEVSSYHLCSAQLTDEEHKSVTLIEVDIRGRVGKGSIVRFLELQETMCHLFNISRRYVCHYMHLNNCHTLVRPCIATNSA